MMNFFEFLEESKRYKKKFQKGPTFQIKKTGISQKKISLKNTSILIPVFDRPQHFYYLCNYLNLTCKKLELVVIDAGNTENSELHRATLKKLLENSPNIKVIYESHPGISPVEQLMRASDAATKKFVIRCPDDDFILPSSMREMEQKLDQCPDAVAISSRVLSVAKIKQKMAYFESISHGITDKFLDKRLLLSSFTVHNCGWSMIKRKEFLDSMNFVEPLWETKLDYLWDRFISFFLVIQGKFLFHDYYGVVRTYHNRSIRHGFSPTMSPENFEIAQENIHLDRCGFLADAFTPERGPGPFNEMLKRLDREYEIKFGQSMSRLFLTDLLIGLTMGAANYSDHLPASSFSRLIGINLSAKGLYNRLDFQRPEFNEIKIINEILKSRES